MAAPTGPIQGCCGLECPGNEQADAFSNNGGLFSRDSARQGMCGFPLRTAGGRLLGTLNPGVAGNGPFSLSTVSMRARLRVRSYCASGEDIFCQLTNTRGSTGHGYLALDNAGVLRMYVIGGTYAARVEVSTYIGSYTTLTLALGVWYQLQWFINWGVNAFAGDVPGPTSPSMSFLLINEDTLVQSGWAGSATSFPVGWMAAAPGTHTRTYCQTNDVTFGFPSITGYTYQGTRMDVDSVCAEGLNGTELVGPNGDDYSPAGVPAGSLIPRMCTPTRIPLVGTTNPGSWVVNGTAAPLDYRILNDVAPVSVDSVGCVSSTTPSDTFEVTCGTPADAGFGEADCLGVFLSLRMVTSPFANHTLQIKIGATTYSKTIAGAGGNNYFRFSLPTQGLSPEFSSFPSTSEVRVGFVKDASATQVTIQNMHVEILGTQDWTPLPDPEASVSVMTGEYTGNGSFQEITTPHQPHWIWVSPAAANISDGVYWHDTKLGSTEWIAIGQTTNLMAPSAAGFVVSGNDFATNRSGTVYRWYAIRDGTQRLLYRGAFMEDVSGAATYTITDGLGVLPATFGTPVVLWAHVDDFQAPSGSGAYYRGLGHTGTLSSGITGADLSTAIRTMPTPGSGFTIGSSLGGSSIAQASFTAWSLAFLTTKLWGVASWTGNGVASRDLAVDLGGKGGGWCLAFSRAGGQAFYRTASMVGTASMTVASGSSSSQGILGFKTDAVTVGSNLNANGVLYELLVIVDPTWTGSGTGIPPGEITDVPPANGCLLTFRSGTDSAGGSGCQDAFAAGSDSGGGSGCQVS